MNVAISLDSLSRWVVDAYVLGSLLLVACAAASWRLRQPSRRLAVARACSAGVIVLLVLAAMPAWPRASWRAATDEVSGIRAIARDAHVPTLSSRGDGPLAQPAPDPMRQPIAVAGMTEHAGEVRPAAGPPPVAFAWPDVSAIRGWAIRVYVGGAVVAVVWLMLGAIQAGRLLGASRPAPEELDRWMRGAGGRLRVSDRIGQPMAVGLVHPAILLPEAITSAESDAALAAVIRHEEAHVRNGDLYHLAILGLLLPVLYLHPLYWWMRRRVRLDQELLADAAATGDDRAAYAETLLGWARSGFGGTHRRHAGALALVERPSELFQRIAALLDPTWDVEARCPGGWRVGAWGLVLPAALGLSFATMRPAAAGRGVRVGEPQAAVPSGEAVIYRGRVVDPDGKPFAGAKLYLSYHRGSGSGRPQAVRAWSDRDGRFRFAVPLDEFDQPQLEIWRGVRVVAIADGHAPGGSDSAESDADHEVTIRLARDDLPLVGRLVDLEGRPVAGGSVHVVSIEGPPDGDLGPWLAAAAERRSTEYEMNSRHLRRLRLREYDGLPAIPVARTDADGRFAIRGIGRERLASLRVEGPTIRTTEVSVLTRVGEPVRVSVFGSRKNDRVKVYQPARFEISAPPSRPVKGIVRDRDTGAPIVGVEIRSFRLADEELSNDQLVRARTDKDGRFRLTGLPLGKGNAIYLFSPKDQPYLPSLRWLDELTAAGPLRAEFVLKRGVWLSGKVTDKTTGKAAVAYLRYGAAKDNPHLAEAPGFAEILGNGDYTSAQETDGGNFRIAVLPGRGLVAAWANGAIYPALDPQAPGYPRLDDYLPALYWGHAFAVIDVRNDQPAPRGDMVLDAGRTVEASAVDPDGKPVSGARVNGQWTFEGWGGPLVSDRFTIYGLIPPKPKGLGAMLRSQDLETLAGMIRSTRPRLVVVQHEGRKLAGWAEVAAEAVGPVTIRLRPSGSVAGRMVDSGGEPRAHFSFQPEVIDALKVGLGRSSHWPTRVTTDASGRFRIDGLAPGLRYRLSLEAAMGATNTLRGPEVAPLGAGEHRELGDIVAIVPGEAG